MTIIPRTALLLAALLALAGVAHAQPTAQPSLPDTARASRAERPTTVTPREGCVTADCHPGVKAKPFLHGPINANACDSCHTLKDAAAHTFNMARPKEQLCAFCHTSAESASGPGTSIHQPFAEGECLSCHDPHGSREPAILRGQNYADSCNSCHKDVTGAHDSVHGPASAGACGACHQPHVSRFPKLLNANGNDLCFRCHTSTARQIKSKLVVHQPVAKGDCRVCHAAHATDQPAMLNEDPAKLCTSCHQDIASKMEHATTQHAAVTSKRSCLNCHTAHAGDYPKLLREPEINLCLECHNTTISLKDGGSILNMKAVIEQGKSLHGAIAAQSCAACHDIHGGERRRLLVNEYPNEMYLPFTESAYALCFNCHDKNLVMQKETTAVTSFRNGQTNLHFVHVNRQDKGRSCRTCHDSHAATRDRHIRDEVPFGPMGWRLPIKYEALAGGGKCGAGCHAAFEYNRTTPVVYPDQKGGTWKGVDLPAPTEKPPPPPDLPPQDPAKPTPPKK
jgi:predicted CXXCH cytochrome family protein